MRVGRNAVLPYRTTERLIDVQCNTYRPLAALVPTRLVLAAQLLCQRRRVVLWRTLLLVAAYSSKCVCVSCGRRSVNELALLLLTDVEAVRGVGSFWRV